MVAFLKNASRCFAMDAESRRTIDEKFPGAHGMSAVTVKNPGGLSVFIAS